jgi:hypothetical protein
MFKDLGVYYKFFLGLLCFFVLLGLGTFYLRTNKLAELSKPVGIEVKAEKLFYSSIGEIEIKENKISSTEPEPSQRYTLEFKTVKTQREAIDLVDHLTHRGLDGYYTPIQKNGVLIFLVRQGIYNLRQDAQKAAKKLLVQDKIHMRVAKL